MTEENLRAARADFERFARGDFSGLDERSDLPLDYEIVTAPEMPDAGTYRGEAARAWARAWVESFDSLSLEPVDILGAGDKVMVEFIQRGTPRGGTATVELRTWSVETRSEGTLRRTELFMSRAQALEAAGLADSA